MSTLISKQFSKGLKRSTLAVALGLCFIGGVQAQSNTSGAVAGNAVSGDTITVSSPATGFSRTITVGTDGNYRFSALPTGKYKIIRKTADGTTTTRDATVNVGTAANVDFVSAAGPATTLDTVTVVGTGAINPIDVSSVESSTILTEEQIDRLPVARDQTSIALLAPGTVRGDAEFGNLASFGGASVAENVYYVNGFNVTNILTGTSFNQVPFEAIAEQQIKTGGYGAEFGRSLGGVLNVITKRGTNEWKFGGNAYWNPKSLREGTPNAIADGKGGFKVIEDKDQTDELIYNIYGSGPIVKDRLFIFGVLQGQNIDSDLYGVSRSTDNETKSPQGLVKLDWNITDSHIVELTAFRDRSRKDTVSYTLSAPYTGSRVTQVGTATEETGGDNYVAKWTGYLSDTFTLSALYGQGEYTRSNDNSQESCPRVIDVRTNPQGELLGCWVTSTTPGPNNGDERKAWRIDGEWALGDHTLKFGLDSEEFTTVDSTQYSGNEYFLYQRATAGSTLNGGTVPGTPGEKVDVVRRRVLQNGGNFLTSNKAWYVEDSWQISDNFLAYLGVRNESFENLNSLGGSFINVEDTWAPRLGFSWDVNGDSTFKVFGNAGRYYIPVYANTNVRLAGAETDYREFYTFTGINPVTGAPTGLTQIGNRSYISQGGVPDPKTVVDPDISPMFQDEMILGFQQQLSETWSLGVRAIRRELKRGMDDYCGTAAFTAWAEDNNHTNFDPDSLPTCLLINPGQDITTFLDLDGSGNLTKVTIPASYSQLPVAKRHYSALEVFWERGWDEKWFLQGSYTYAKSIGNTEGYVKSDNGQDDAGLTQDFDFVGLTDGAYGYLPNDRRHTLKTFGAYQLNEEWRLGGNLLVQSGRPLNCFGVYAGDGPDVAESEPYGVASFYCDTLNSNRTNGDGTPNSNYRPSYGTSGLRGRGTSGRTPWIKQFDLQVAYEPKWSEGLRLQMDVVNLFNEKGNRSADEEFEIETREPSSNYGAPRQFQTPRYFRFSVEYDF